MGSDNKDYKLRCNIILLSCLFLMTGINLSAQKLTDLLSSDMDESVVSTADAGPAALLSSPALISSAKFRMLGLYADNRFGIKEMGLMKFSAVFPHVSGQSFGIQLSRAGLDHYNENRFTLTYARKLNESTWIGMSAGGEWFTKSKYKQAFLPRSALGLLIRWSQRSAFGFVIQNPWQPFLGKTNRESSNMIFMAGYAYQYTEQLRFSIDFKKFVSSDWFLIFGVGFSPSKQLSLQYHYRTGANTHELGAIIPRKRISTRVYISFHQTLGMSGGAGIFNGQPKRTS